MGTSRAAPAAALGSVSSELCTIVRACGGGAAVVGDGCRPLSIGMADAAAGTASVPATMQAAARRRGIMGRTSWGRIWGGSEDLAGRAACPFAVRRIVLAPGPPY